MTATITPYKSDHSAGRDGFGQLLRAEWTKFRTVRGWVIALVAVAVVTAVIPIDLASSASNAVESCAGGSCQAEGQNIAVGPAGEAVTDTFYFVHQPLAGNGSITVRVTSLQGSGSQSAVPGFADPPRTLPWAKAGIMIKQSTTPGSPYAAVMVTGGHGVRMQDNFTRDTAGPAGAVSAASPRWLRLTRSGSTLTGYESADGRHWSAIGTADLSGLPPTVQAGLFVASPDWQQATQSFGGGDNGLDLGTQATAGFDHLTVAGRPAGQSWSGSRIGKGLLGASAHVRCTGGPCTSRRPAAGAFKESGGTFTVVGTGDIAPFVPIVKPLQVSFYGTLFGLLAVIALGALFITGEYRRGLIRTTLTASPRRGRVLVAKAIVIGSVTFAAGLIGAATAFPIAERELNANGYKPPVWHVMSLTSGIGLQVVVGTALLVAVTAVLAMCAGAILRRSAGAIAVVVGLVVFPLILAIVLPLAPADWLLRVTPAAAFSLQQAFPRYSQLSSGCVPYHGCYPLAPWTGFAVMCAWAVAALGLAIFLLRRRDV
jgi:ABC-type transport system involved in multi-copper enzyme maturation permease subunit